MSADSLRARSRSRALLIGAAAISLLLALCASPLRAQGATPPMPGPEPRFLSDADFEWRLVRLDGSELRLAELRGRVLFINIWASWCAPCVRELPSIEALRDSVTGVEFLAVSPERPDRARGWLETNRIRLPVYFEGSETPALLGLTMVPTTYVVDRAGAIVFAWRGATDWDRPETRSLLRALVAEVGAAPGGTEPGSRAGGS